MPRRGLRLVASIVVVAVVAGCSGNSSSAAPASAAAGSTMPAASGAPAASATPPASSATPASSVAVDGLIAKMGNTLGAADATYRLDGNVEVSFGMTFDYEMHYLIAGADAQMNLVMKAGPTTTTVQVVVKDGKGFTSTDGKTWKDVDASSLGAAQDEFTFLATPGAYVLDGTDAATGALRFKTAKPLPYAASGAADYTFSDTQMSDVVLLVKEDGTPVSVEGKLSGKATDKDGKESPITGSLSYKFSDVGAKLEVVAPK